MPMAFTSFTTFSETCCHAAMHVMMYTQHVSCIKYLVFYLARVQVSIHV